MLYHQDLFHVPEIIQKKLISKHHNNLLASYFGIKKINKFVAQKYYLPKDCHNTEDYVKECNIYLALKTVWYKPYNNL